MRHGKRRRFPASSASHARSMIRGMICAILEHGQIITTTAKAKALRPFLERVITRAVHAEEAESQFRRLSLHGLLYSDVRDAAALFTLINVAGRLYAGRPGGYVRILRLGARKGDGAPMSVIQLVTENTPFDAIISEAGSSVSSLPVDRYRFIREYCAQNPRYRSRKLAEWRAYPFPKLELSIRPEGRQTLLTSCVLPDASHWDLERWPTLRGSPAVCALALNFDFQFEGVSVTPDSVSVECSNEIRLFAVGGSPIATGFLLSRPLSAEPARIEVRHHFQRTSLPTQAEVVLVTPYRWLRSSRHVREA